MKRLVILYSVLLFCLFCFSSFTHAKTVTGIVYNDKNKNGNLNRHEKGVKGVAVSNGIDVILTDRKGRYSLELKEGDTKGAQDVINATKSIQDTKTAQVPKAASATLSKVGLKTLSINTFKTLTIPRITPTKPPKIPKLRIKLGKVQRKGSRQAYIIRIKEGNKIIAQSDIPLPRNRATNLMRTRLDNSPRASGDLVPRGKTDIVDVQKAVLTKKFREKRSKKTKVLRNVEKRKYRIDKPGERKGLKKTKRNK